MVKTIFITFVRGYERILLVSGLVIISVVVAVDMYLDLRDGLPPMHLLHEALILGFCLILTLFQVRIVSSQKQKILLKEQEIQGLKSSRDEFRHKSLRFSEEFSDAVFQQFTQWGLTSSECDVALLLIKGLSMKEIAEDRHSKEATVRQQATSIYRKAGLSGRQELTAFFLEDLFSPLS